MTKALKNTRVLLGIFLLSGFGSLIIGCSAVDTIDLPGFSYLSQPISLDVSKIEIIDETTEENPSSSVLIPKSMVPMLREWVDRRFLAVGQSGTATITFKEGKVFESGLIKDEDIHVLLNSEKPAYFGSKVWITLDLANTPAYSKGKTEVKLERKVEVASDIKLSFHHRLWQKFSQTFMNALDDQMMLNLQTYLPSVLKKDR